MSDGYVMLASKIIGINAFLERAVANGRFYYNCASDVTLLCADNFYTNYRFDLLRSSCSPGYKRTALTGKQNKRLIN